MAYELEEIAKELKQARDNKGLSQRALSSLADVPQSHLSKVENGNVDIRLSSLIQIARALDLEVKLVPKKALPAVETVVRSTSKQTQADQQQKALDKLEVAAETARTLNRIMPDLSVLDKTSKIISDLKIFNFDNSAINKLDKILEPLNRISKLVSINYNPSADIKNYFDNNSNISTLAKMQELKSTTEALQDLRNQLAHRSPISVPQPSPAYRLDEDDDA
jgi:transcriptional regulator with XRE-family HTH domain